MTNNILDALIFPKPVLNDTNIIELLEPFMYSISNIIAKTTRDENHVYSNVIFADIVTTDEAKNTIPTIIEPQKVEPEIIVTIPENANHSNHSNITQRSNTRIQKDPNLYSPRKTDTLFWCMYIAVYGIVEYKMIGAHYGNKIMEEKQKIMNYLEKNPHCLKDTNKKITKVAFQEIMSEFMVDRKTSLHSFIAMCKFYKQNVIIVNKNTYMEFIVSPEEIPVIFIGKTTGKNDTFYEIDLDTTHTKIDGIKNTKWLIENTEKPLKGIGTYSVLELQYIIQKLQIRLDDHKYKKMELYELIIHCVCA